MAISDAYRFLLNRPVLVFGGDLLFSMNAAMQDGGGRGCGISLRMLVMIMEKDKREIEAKHLSAEGEGLFLGNVTTGTGWWRIF